MIGSDSGPIKSKVLIRNTLYHIVWFHYDSWMKAILSRTSQGFCIHGRTIFSKERCREMLCGNFRSMRQAKPTNKPPPNLWNMNRYIRKSWSLILLSCWEITFRLPESPPWETDSPRFPFVKSSNISESFLMASCGIWMTYRLDALIGKFWFLVLDDQLVKWQYGWHWRRGASTPVTCSQHRLWAGFSLLWSRKCVEGWFSLDYIE